MEIMGEVREKMVFEDDDVWIINRREISRIEVST